MAEIRENPLRGELKIYPRKELGVGGRGGRGSRGRKGEWGEGGGGGQGRLLLMLQQ